MDDNKDDYLKKKLHIKDRFIKRLETEKRQLELDNNTLKHRLGLVECRVNSLTRNRRKAACEGLETISQQEQGSQSISVEPQAMASSVLPRYIPFPNSRTPSAEVASSLHERIPMPAVNVGQDVKKNQLLNENLEYVLEISYLKARLKSSDAARTVAERKIESLEEKLKHLEKAFGREMVGNVENVGLDCSHPSINNSDKRNSQSKPSSAPHIINEAVHPSDVGTASNSAKIDGVAVYNTLMNYLNRILQLLVSLDEKMNRIQRERKRQAMEITS